MRLRLHHSPLACSLASRMALAETGLDHEIAVVRLAKGEHLTEAYGRINPRRKVPALETDQGVITETSAILPYIADLAPDRGLMPATGYPRAVAQAWLGFLSSTLHPNLTRALFAERLAADPTTVEAIRAQALEAASGALRELDAHLQDRAFMLDAFSVCDLHLLVFLLWRGGPALAGRLPALPNLDAFQQRLLARPSLSAIVADEMKLMAGA